MDVGSLTSVDRMSGWLRHLEGRRLSSYHSSQRSVTWPKHFFGTKIFGRQVVLAGTHFWPAHIFGQNESLAKIVFWPKQCFGKFRQTSMWS